MLLQMAQKSLLAFGVLLEFVRKQKAGVFGDVYGVIVKLIRLHFLPHKF